MELKEGAILYIKDFEFGKKGAVKKKNKYLIVLLELEGNRLMFSLPSSQVYISKEKQKAGCINHKDMGISIFCFEQGDVIGQDGFAFKKDTFVYYAQVLERSTSFLDAYMENGQLEVLDCLSKHFLTEVLYCALKSTVIPTKYIPFLEEKLEELLQ